MLSTLRKEDCGCGGGKSNCITRNVMKKWVNDELKRLDCGCGCKGASKFVKKYGLVGGKILADCKPGWRNDGLTCVSPCNPDERDDGLSCRAKCKPGQIDDGLTCRNPIQSSMNDCPAGSHDVWGTCWGPGHKWCVDDCFTKPAPGCRTWECGRLKGLFGEDWGPRLCTECNLRCGQTCWHTNVITKQLHERELKIWGGEVNGQAIRWKTVEGRVDFVELGQTIKGGLEYTFSADGPLAQAFDPEKNGFAQAVRKFGDDMKNILEDIGARIKKGFEDFGAAAKKAFEDFGSLVAEKFIAFGEGFVAMLKDPMFWAEVIGVLAIIGSTALSIAGTALTAGMGAPAFAALMAASAMVGPATKMIVKASRGEPIDGLDIANLLISGASAAIPGMSGMTAALMKAGTTAASVIVTGVQVGQGLGLIPSSCIANCPAPPTVDVPGIPPQPPQDPPPAGQKSDAEILALAPPFAFNRILKDPRRPNPDWIGMTEADYIAKYRKDHYDNATEGPGGELVDPEDNAIGDAVDVVPDAPPIYADDLETPNPIDEFPGFEPMPGDGMDEFPGFEPMPGDGMDEFPGFEPMPPLEGGADPLLRVVDKVDRLSSFWGSDQKKASSSIPYTQKSNEFNAKCYAQRNPEKLKDIANDEAKLTTHWIEIGSKHKNDWPADCEESAEDKAKRQALIKAQVEEKQKASSEEIKGVKKLACNATDRFWDDVKLECDGRRHADGRPKTEAQNCDAEGSYWAHEGTKKFCDHFRDKNGKLKSKKDQCAVKDNFWDGTKCDLTKNVDGSAKAEFDYCVGQDNFYDTKTNTCDVKKDRDSKPKSEELMCESGGNYWGRNFILGAVNYTDARGTRFGKRVGAKDSLSQLIVGNTIPSFNVNDFIAKYKIEDASPGELKELEINYLGPSGKFERVVARNGENVPTLTGIADHTTVFNSPMSGKSYYGCHPKMYTNGKLKNNDEYCQTGLQGNSVFGMKKVTKDGKRIDLNTLVNCDHALGRFPGSYSQMEDFLKTKKFDTKFFPNNEWAELPEPTGSGKPKSLTLYYANWCHFCKVLMPTWRTLGSEYKGIKIVAIEEQQNTSFPVDGYPTIVYRDGSRMEKYEGQRTKAGIVNFLKSKL